MLRLDLHPHIVMTQSVVKTQQFSKIIFRGLLLATHRLEDAVREALREMDFCCLMEGVHSHLGLMGSVGWCHDGKPVW